MSGLVPSFAVANKTASPLSVDEKQQQAAESKHRYLARNKRLKAQEEDRNNKYLKMKRRNKDEAIKAALNRAQKRSSKET